MRSIGGLSGCTPVQALCGDGILVGVTFTTDGSNDPTLLDTLGGNVTIARATNTYTLSFKANWAKTKVCLVTHTAVATVNCVPTITASTGTVALAFSGAMTSQRVDVLLLVSPNARG